jgi:bifunctional UDP-N-acetylglucosamine pyrophosphorylase/glucosamine-1-phosphate N-acetyltransferase
MLEWVLGAARAAGCEHIYVVVGHGADQVQDEIDADDVTWVLQEEQLGTGHALLQVASHLKVPTTLLVLSGDVPLVTPETLERLAVAARVGWGSMVVAEMEDPGSLGRVVAASDGTLESIVEVADASDEELENPMINAGVYALPAPGIFDFLTQLKPDNAKQELYLTDALSAAADGGEDLVLVSLLEAEEACGVNDRLDLVRVHGALLRRKAEELMREGVTILDPNRVVIEADVVVGRDSVIHPGVSLTGRSRLGESCTVHQGAWLRDARLGDRVIVQPYSVLEGVEVGDACQIGPFARMRPGAVMKERAKIGNFVEVKNSELGEGVKANHLAYVGDATVGENSNLGAGTITCNYDGLAKHRTEIGKDVFVGSDTMFVAPVRLGDGAMTAAGSVITKDVPSGALAIERSEQKNIAGYGQRKLERRKARKK